MAESTDPFAYIRDYYRVPASVGRRVVVDGHPGVITGSRGHYLLVRFEHGASLPCHPTWRVEYLPAVEGQSDG